MHGYVYFLKCSNGYFKIGYSEKPLERAKQIRNPGEPMKLVHLIYTNNMRACEKRYHEVFKEYRVGNSEWFNLPDQDVRWIKLELATWMCKHGEWVGSRTQDYDCDCTQVEAHRSNFDPFPCDCQVDPWAISPAVGPFDVDALEEK